MNKLLKQYKDVFLRKSSPDEYTVQQGRSKTVTKSILVALEEYCRLVLKDIDDDTEK